MKTKKDENDFTKVINNINSYKKKDFSFSNGHILGSMCSSPHPIAKKVYSSFLETNLGDPGLFPGTKKIEQHFISFIKNLMHAPDSSHGHIVSGGTEGNITAMWIAKQLTHKKEIVVPSSAHFSFLKIARLMDMTLKTIPLSSDYTVEISALKKAINSDTTAVLGIAGTTDVGAVDPISDIATLCDEEHIFFHVDAAFGGFIIPFLNLLGYSVPVIDFSVNGISSISLDAHKMGYAAIPLGTILIREKKWIEEISVESQCVSSEKQAGILGTRSGAPVAAAYAVTQYLGMNGYKKIMKHCMQLTDYTAKRLQDIGLKLILEKPPLNILAVKLNHLDKIVDMLSKRGWKVNKITHLSAIRIVIMPHITKEIIDEFITVFQKTCREVGEL